MNSKAVIYLLLAASLACGCGARKTSGNDGARSRAFPAVKVPAMLTDIQERADYVCSHFWDGLGAAGAFLCDSTHAAGIAKETLEEQMGMFSTLLSTVSAETARKSVSTLFDVIESCEARDSTSNLFETLCDLTAKYLYDPNSPVRDEDAYQPFVEKLSRSRFTPDSMRGAYAFDSKMCGLNRIGSQAADFEFKDLDGELHSLYGLKADYTLLLFTNPGCPDCKETIEALSGNDGVSEMLRDGSLAVANVYIDTELDKWKAFAQEYPTEWTSGYDHKYLIRTDVIYNVRAIPSLYLLDKDKRVILKDAPVNRILEALAAAEL